VAPRSGATWRHAFWLEASGPVALRPGGIGRNTAISIRVMHSMIRRNVGWYPEWDAAWLGAALSQNPQVGTISLSFLITRHARLIGF